MRSQCGAGALLRFLQHEPDEMHSQNRRIEDGGMRCNTGFRYFKRGTRTVDDAGLIQIDSAYYAAFPAAPRSEVTVRVFEGSIEILDATGALLRRH